ncbi:hypothetical protein FOMPIDRAFT_129888 [Fomitopsis schrenkii]|uniref:Uncharacterized protein n=1 Tax=Fomitopsis schrenkii TaxID=2126942 RepID=S8E9L6_FOMSC|nr:hypothetical protein FOMPIDRAFT_129888 [Fomitopsis schrenkii]
MATNWWRVATNPSYLSDDEIHAIKDADHLVLSLAPSPPEAIPKTITFCQVIGVMNNRPSYDYIPNWIDLNDTGNSPIDWNAFGRDHPRRASGDARQLTESMRDYLEHEIPMFLRLYGYYFHHFMAKIYVVQVFEKRAWGIRFLLQGRINGVELTLISVPALAHLSLDLTTVVPSIKRARSMLEVDEY